MRLFNKKPKKDYSWLGANTEMTMTTIKPPKETKIIAMEKIEDLKPFIDAALLLNLSFIIYNKEIGTDENPINIYCFETK